MTARLKAKTQRTDELTSDVARLRDELDARTMDLDTLRARDLRGDSVSRENIAQLERDIANLRELLDLHEQKSYEMTAILEVTPLGCCLYIPSCSSRVYIYPPP